ncbi:unnamed protein product [Meloidogyne enterolobii]|uniref:Uncharacterized protein n=1 Tax=Meloidogyne enterolobii TaxID=390850 RepID=A0ACB0Y9Y3_MELEN
MKEKGVKNFNEIPSNTQVYDAVSPPQNSGLYSSPASSNNPQQNLSNPPNQFTYNLSHINHPSHQQGSSGFINTALLNTIDANEHQKSLKSKSDISGFETQFKGKYLGNKWENKWDAKLKALNDSEDERKKAIEKYSQYIGNVHDTLLGNDNYNDNVFNNPHLDKMQKSLENVVSGSSQHQTPPAQNFNKNHEHASEIDADDYVDLGSNSEN